jgi:cytoskeletal protein CcmA (bactofilin family)
MWGQKDKVTAALTTTGPAAADVRSVTLATTTVDASSEFTGTLKTQKAVHIEGKVEGDVDCGSTVTIGNSGKVTAHIRAESVLIDGEVHGDIEARTEITLRKTARVFGDLKTEGIVIERGAKVEGQITIGPTGGGRAASPAAPAARDAQTPTLAMPAPKPKI